MPYASYELLCWIDCLYHWLFVVDEQLDHVTTDTSYIRAPGYIEKFISRFVEILRFNKIYLINQDNLLAALSTIWNNLVSLTTPRWQHQFAISFQATFEAAIWEAKNNRNKNHRPTLLQYMHMRQYFSAANMGTDITELATGVNLPVYVLQHPSIINIVELARRAVCWGNDLFSLAKELSHGDEHNLVILIMYEQNIPLDEAIRQAASIHDTEILEFITLKWQLPDFGRKLNKQVEKFVLGLETMISGFFFWSIDDTPRYSLKFAELQKLDDTKHK